MFPLDIPPLRERGGDIITLANIFSERFARKIGITVNPLTGEQIEWLTAYRWPGNVRELQNVMERAVITSRAGELNLDSALPAGSLKMARTATAPEADGDGRVLTHKELLDLERSNIVAALEKSGWRVSGEKGAARLLGVPSTTLSSRIKTLGIKRRE